MGIAQSSQGLRADSLWGCAVDGRIFLGSEGPGCRDSVLS